MVIVRAVVGWVVGRRVVRGLEVFGFVVGLVFVVIVRAVVGWVVGRRVVRGLEVFGIVVVVVVIVVVVWV